MDGDKAKATEILKIRDKQNSRKKNILSKTSQNPQFKNFNIQMPVVPADELVGTGGVTYFVPPRIYVDLGQNDWVKEANLKNPT